MGIVIAIPAMGAMMKHDIKSDLDFFVGFGAALVGVLLAVIVCSEISSDN
jgi:hypothetical protein